MKLLFILAFILSSCDQSWVKSLDVNKLFDKKKGSHTNVDVPAEPLGTVVASQESFIERNHQQLKILHVVIDLPTVSLGIGKKPRSSVFNLEEKFKICRKAFGTTKGCYLCRNTDSFESDLYEYNDGNIAAGLDPKDYKLVSCHEFEEQFDQVKVAKMKEGKIHDFYLRKMTHGRKSIVQTKTNGKFDDTVFITVTDKANVPTIGHHMRILPKTFNAQFTKQGKSPANYDYTFYYVKKSITGAWGQAEIGGNELWSYDTCFDYYLCITHEMGHLLGFHHAEGYGSLEDNSAMMNGNGTHYLGERNIIPINSMAINNHHYLPNYLRQLDSRDESLTNYELDVLGAGDGKDPVALTFVLPLNKENNNYKRFVVHGRRSADIGVGCEKDYEENASINFYNLDFMRKDKSLAPIFQKAILVHRAKFVRNIADFTLVAQPIKNLESGTIYKNHFMAKNEPYDLEEDKLFRIENVEFNHCQTKVNFDMSFKEDVLPTCSKILDPRIELVKKDGAILDKGQLYSLSIDNRDGNFCRERSFTLKVIDASGKEILRHSSVILADDTIPTKESVDREESDGWTYHNTRKKRKFEYRFEAVDQRDFHIEVTNSYDDKKLTCQVSDGNIQC